MIITSAPSSSATAWAWLSERRSSVSIVSKTWPLNSRGFTSNSMVNWAISGWKSADAKRSSSWALIGTGEPSGSVM